MLEPRRTRAARAGTSPGRVVGPVAAGAAAQEREHLVLVRLVEPLEREECRSPSSRNVTAGPRCEVDERRGRRTRRVGRVRARRAGAGAGGDRPRARDVGGGRGRRSRRGGPAREPRRLVPLLHGARRRRARPPLARGARGTRRHRPCGHAPAPQRRAFTHVDEAGERTITVLGDKLLPVRRGRHRSRGRSCDAATPSTS